MPLYFLGETLFAQGLVTPLFNKTLLWCFFPYVLVVKLHYDLISLSLSDKLLLPLVTLVPFLVLILIFALLQARYARSPVLIVCVVTVTLFWFASRFFLSKIRLKLLLLQPAAWRELQDRFPNGLPKDPVVELLSCTILEEKSQPPKTFAFDGIMVGDPDLMDAKVAQQLAFLKQNHVRLYTVSSLFEILTERVDIISLKDPLWHPEGNPMLDFIKRVFDILFIFVTAPIWVPLVLLVAVLVKLSSPEPFFFTQTRTGQFGKPFTLLKFRTMRNGNAGEASFTGHNDHRVTSLGKFLRRTRLDELPQLFNVLTGSMSLIGPRPEQQRFVEDFAVSLPSYPYRHLVRPGISGWAQVMQGYAASKQDTLVKLSYDLYYVKHYSLSLDLLILSKTVRVVFTGFGAR